MAAGVKTIIVLSFVRSTHGSQRPLRLQLTLCDQILAIGFILVILSSALYHNFLTLLVVATYVLAPVPNWICSKAQSNDDFMDSGSSSIVELGRFMTGFFVVMGIGTLDFTIPWRDMWAGQDGYEKHGREDMDD
jgi:hypothetical protein